VEESATAEKRKSPRSGGFHEVERRGIEPLTSSMPC
jgi:hypothetical protein